MIPTLKEIAGVPLKEKKREREREREREKE